MANLLPQNRAELYAFIQVVLAAIAILLTAASTQSISIKDVDVDINRVIEITIEQQQQPPSNRPSVERSTGVSTRSAETVGRNEPCPCGSGKKYKKCHGDPVKDQ